MIAVRLVIGARGDLVSAEAAGHAGRGPAGADIVCISSASRFAILENRATELPLAEIIERMGAVDIILTEGYKRERYPKIEVFRQAAGHSPLGYQPDLLAVVSDVALYPGVKQFGFEQTVEIADFLEKICFNSV